MNDSIVESSTVRALHKYNFGIEKSKFCLDPGCFVAECYYKTVTFTAENCHSHLSELGGAQTPSDQHQSSLASSSSSQVSTE